jgi:DNA topoisomerase VI subunit B
MALRAFHSNPCIGGFGGESSFVPVLLDPSGNHPKTGQQHCHSNSPQDGDAFCQIVKELVDNAVDACSAAGTANTNQRVKVEIQPYDSDKNDILQVTISDNGCGMTDIQACVDAFQSTKNHGHSTSTHTTHTNTTHTAGRYGIGLTLCLVHGQRLVPNSYACITSATREATHFTRAFYIVDTQGDSVNCHKQEQIKKTCLESGTCVSLLVPVSEIVVLKHERQAYIIIIVVSHIYISWLDLVLNNRAASRHSWHGLVLPITFCDFK